MNSIILDIDMLRCFLAVVRTGGFTKAGEEIGLTQSGVSIKIKRLEERLGTLVLRRTSKTLSLTPEGEILKGYAMRILESHDEAVQRLYGPKTAGRLKVGMAEYFIPNILPALLSRFRKHYPNIRLEITAGLGMMLLPLFDQGKLDLVVAGRHEHQDPDRALVDEPLMWMMGDECELKSDRPIPLAMLPAPCSFRQNAIETLDSRNMPWEIVFTGTSIASIQAAVKAGLGISVLPAGAMSPGLRQVPVRYDFPVLPHHILALFTDPKTQHPVKSVFIDYLDFELSKYGK